MSNVVNWKKIVLFSAALFLVEVVVGFITGGLDASEQRLIVSSVLSLFFSTLLFSAMGAGQHRPFLHAFLAFLLTFLFSLGLGAILPTRLTETPLVLLTLEWLTLALGLVIGTSIARYVGLRRARADA